MSDRENLTLEDTVNGVLLDDKEELFENDFLEPFPNKSETEKFYDNLGEKLRIAREEAGLTLASLAEKVGLTGAAIKNYEVGIRQVPVHLLIEFSRILNKPIHSFLGPKAEPAISIKETLMNTLERYTEAVYAKRLMDLKDGKLIALTPEPLIPMHPEICKNHDLTIRFKSKDAEVYSYYFIKLARPISFNHVRTNLNGKEISVPLKPDDWVLAKIGDTHDFEIVQVKNITPTTFQYSNQCDLATYNVAGLVLGKAERLVNLND